jgi:hypothetical protein
MNMRQRLLQLTGVAATVAAVSLALAMVAGQAPTHAQQASIAKTSWGEPDLQGIWTINYQIPLQRPEKYKDKEFFTDAEIAALDDERAAKPGFGDKRGERGTERDVAGAYDSRVFLTRRHTGRRAYSSLHASGATADQGNTRVPARPPRSHRDMQEQMEGLRGRKVHRRADTTAIRGL